MIFIAGGMTTLSAYWTKKQLELYEKHGKKEDLVVAMCTGTGIISSAGATMNALEHFSNLW